MNRVKSNEHTYGRVAATIHWLSAALIIIMLISGFRAGSAVDPAEKLELLRLHMPLGIVVLLLTAARILWWWEFDNKPKPIAMPRWQSLVASSVHTLLYIVILGMAVSGIGMIALSGAGSIIAGESSEALPNFWDYLPRKPHGIGARVMLALFVLHAGAALYHHFVAKDSSLRRIWFTK